MCVVHVWRPEVNIQYLFLLILFETGSLTEAEAYWFAGLDGHWAQGFPPFMSPQHWDYWPMLPLHGSWSLISGPYTWTSSILPSKVFIQLWRQFRSKPEHKEKEVNKHFSKVMSLTTHFMFAWVFLGRCCLSQWNGWITFHRGFILGSCGVSYMLGVHVWSPITSRN